MDYGGTIDTDGKHWSEVIFEAYRASSVALPKDIFRKAYVYGEQSMEREPHVIKPEYNFHKVLEIKIALQAQFLATQKMPIHHSEINQIVDFCYAYAQKTISWQQDTLDKLSGKYPIVLVSNFYGNLTSVLSDFNIERYFQAIVESSVVGYRKPDTRIFTLGLEALKLDASECVVVGDSYTNDILPAQQLGCTTVWLKGIGWDSEDTRTEQASADDTISQLADMVDRF